MIAFLLWLFCAAVAPAGLELEVRQALDGRDSFALSLRERTPLPVLRRADPLAAGRLGVLLSNAEAGQDPWFHLYRGLHERKAGTGKDRVFLDNALFLAKDRPGLLAAMSLELLRQEEWNMAHAAAHAANRAFLAMGGRRSAYLEMLWSQAASRDTAAPERWRELARAVALAGTGPRISPLPALEWPLALVLQASRGEWRACLDLVRHGWNVARAAAALFLAATFVALLVRHHQAVTHPLKEALSRMPRQVGTLVAWLPLVGLALAGWTVLGWGILLGSAPRWRSAAERGCGLAAGLFLLLAPLDAWLGGVWIGMDTGTGRAGSLVAALDAPAATEDTLAAGAVQAWREGNPALALRRLDAALAQDSAGYLRTLREGLRRESESGTSRGEAGALPEPTLAQMAGLLLREPWSGQARSLWDVRSFLPPWIHVLVSLACLGGLGGLVRRRDEAEGRSVEACVVCGHTTCPRCRRSGLCPRCHQALAAAGNENERRRLRLGRVARRVALRQRLQQAGNSLLPGWGSLMAAPSPERGTMLYLAVGCLALGLAVHALLWVGDVPGTPAVGLRLLGCLPAALWCGGLFLRARLAAAGGAA